jgi:hypothetical protein
LKEGSRFFCGAAEGQAAVRTFFSGSLGRRVCTAQKPPNARQRAQKPRRRPPNVQPPGVLAGRETKRLTLGVIGLRNGKKGLRVNHHTRESSSRCCRRLPRSVLPLVAAVLLLQYRCSTRGRCCGRSRRGLNPRPSTAGWVGRIANTQRRLLRPASRCVCVGLDAHRRSRGLRCFAS